jgi:hypothetical protein
MEINDKFEAVNDEYLKFEKIENKLSNRPDVHAFILLDKLFPSERKTDLIQAAEHDEYFIEIEGEQLLQLTDNQILELVRCGISYSAEYDCLYSIT